MSKNKIKRQTNYTDIELKDVMLNLCCGRIWNWVTTEIARVSVAQHAFGYTLQTTQHHRWGWHVPGRFGILLSNVVHVIDNSVGANIQLRTLRSGTYHPPPLRTRQMGKYMHWYIYIYILAPMCVQCMTIRIMFQYVKNEFQTPNKLYRHRIQRCYVKYVLWTYLKLSNHRDS
jgi:hypothetical protein